MKYKITDKKKFLIFVVLSVALPVVFAFGVHRFYSVNNSKQQKQNDFVQSDKEDEIEVPAMEIIRIENEKNNIEEQEEKNEITEYENITYGYALSFPFDWHMNNDFSEANFEKVEREGKESLLAGGQTFWSNYSNIDQFTPQNKPDDFRLLSLTVYNDKSATIDDFAEKIELVEFSEKSEYVANGIKGFQYVLPGITKGNPGISVIFQKADRFYVFKPAFVNGDEKTIEIMEQIVRSFRIL